MFGCCEHCNSNEYIIIDDEFKYYECIKRKKVILTDINKLIKMSDDEFINIENHMQLISFLK